MKITIIGWFGTETIGDRAILAGILFLLKHLYKNVELHIGSINPFFTKRVLYEDEEFLREVSGELVNDIFIFDELSIIELNKAIDLSSIVVINGGPLMDMACMYMLEYAVKRASKKKIKTYAFGCGLGPLYTKKYLKCTQNILKHCDVIICRDKISANLARKLVPYKNVNSLICPSAIAANAFLNNNEVIKNDIIAINLRVPAFGTEVTRTDMDTELKNNLEKIMFEAIEKFVATNRKILFVPMHTFFVGMDDRVICNRFSQKLLREYNNNINVEVQNTPLSLKKTMQVFANANICVGTRYHAILLQTILNGNNYILDYTDSKSGKTIGFIEEIQANSFYKNRMIHLQDNSGTIGVDLNENTFKIDNIDKYKDAYISILSNN